jgi:hypothetical protein
MAIDLNQGSDLLTVTTVKTLTVTELKTLAVTWGCRCKKDYK